jgi:hypothetical protein
LLQKSLGLLGHFSDSGDWLPVRGLVRADLQAAIDSRVRFPPPPLFIGKIVENEPKKWLIQNESQNKFADFQLRSAVSLESVFAVRECSQEA